MKLTLLILAMWAVSLPAMAEEQHPIYESINPPVLDAVEVIEFEFRLHYPVTADEIIQNHYDNSFLPEDIGDPLESSDFEHVPISNVIPEG